MSGSQNLTFSLPERRIGFFRSCLNRGSFQACLKNISRVYSYQRNKQFTKYMFVLYFFLIHREFSKLIAQKTRKYDGKNTSAGLKSCLSSIQVHSSRRSLYSCFPQHFKKSLCHVPCLFPLLHQTKRLSCKLKCSKVDLWGNDLTDEIQQQCSCLRTLLNNCLKQVPGQLTDWTTYWLNNWLTERPTAFWLIEWLTEGWA